MRLTETTNSPTITTFRAIYTSSLVIFSSSNLLLVLVKSFWCFFPSTFHITDEQTPAPLLYMCRDKISCFLVSLVMFSNLCSYNHGNHVEFWDSSYVNFPDPCKRLTPNTWAVLRSVKNTGVKGLPGDSP